jgi:hypothetical protein
MATQNINIGINVSDNGTAKKTVKSFQEITQAATQAQSAAAGISAAPVKSTLSPGGTPGSRRASEPAGSQQMMSGQDYGSARGSAGLTGASARDFANQAQGLGGLVRLYATYAANVFAVSAAFRALSDAMDTANMIKGLDQLGASSGVALGSLSKRLASATDNAISLREAMAATVKASSSGMNSDQILRMGTVAKQASIALGVDMADAISRISRGITKLEPELLDELGLFTKTGKAAEDYAKSVGKSVTELTDFERRQAFANAVLAEGEKKFGEIDAKANSYTVLLASIKDASFSALNALNTVLGPVIGLLSQSPGALIAGMVGLATVVIKQAVPALGQLRENLERVAEASASDAYDKAAKAQATLSKALDLELQKVEQGADAKSAIVERSQAELAKARFDGLKNAVEVEKLLNSTVQELREEDFAAASEVARQKEEDAKRWSQSASKSWQARGAAAQEEANITRQLVKEVREHKVAEETLTAAKEKAEKTVRSGAAAYTVLGQNLRLAEAANTQSVKKSIVSNAAYNASLIGLRGSAVLLKNEIDNSGLALTRMGAAALYARGGIAILTGAIATMGAAITKALNVVGILVTVFSLLDTFAGSKKVSQAMKDLSDNIDIANSSAKTFTDTVSASYKGNMLAVASLEAQSTALNEVSVSLTKAAEASIKAQKSLAQGSWYDKTIEFFKDAVGFGIGDKFQETLGESITASVEGLANSPQGDAVKQKFADIFKIDPKATDFEKQLKAKIKALDVAPDSAQAKQSIAYLTELGLKAGIATSRAREFKDALDASVTATKSLADTYKVTSPITTFVETSLASLKKLDLNLQEPEVESFAQNLLDLSEKLAANPIFGPQQSAYLTNYSKQIEKLNTELTDSKKQLKDLQELETPSKTVDRAQLRSQLVATSAAEGKPLSIIEADKVVSGMVKAMDASYNAAIANTKNVIKASETGLRSIGAKFKDSIESGAKYNLDLLIAQLQQTLAEGSTKFVQGILSSLSAKGIVGAAALESKLKQQELDAQKTTVLTMRDLIAAMQINSAAVAKASAQTEKQAADKAYYELPATASTDDRNKAISRVVSANVDLDQTTKQYDLITKAVKNPITALKGLRNEFGVIGESVRTNVMAFAQSMSGFAAQIQKFSSEQEQLDLNAQVKTAEEYYTAQENILNARKQTLETDTKAVQLNVQNKSLTEAQAAAQEDSLKTQAAQLSYEESIVKTAKEYVASSVLIDALEKKAVATKDKGLLALVASAEQTRDTAYNTGVINALKQKGVDIDKIGADRRAKTLQKELSEISKSYELTKALAQLENTKNDIALEQASKELELYSEAYGLSQSYVITQRAALELESERLALTTAITQAEQAMIVRKQEADAQKKALGASASAEALAQIDAETTRQQALSNIAVAGLSLQYSNKVAILDKTREINLEQAHYNELLNTTNSFATQLGSVFKNLGTELGNAVKAMVDFSVTTEKNAKAEIKLEQDLKKAKIANDPAKEKKIQTELDKQKKKSLTQELDGISTVAGESKKLFKEKTFAFKALAAVEKATAIASLALKAQDMAATLATLPTKIAGGVAKLFDQGGWAGFAGAAAFLALMASLGAKGGGGSSGAFVPTAEQRQETQGTAMGYDSQGNKVQVRQGVFGDTEAKSAAITNSLERLAENSVEGLDYDNKMLKALRSIASSIDGAAKGLYRIPGIVSGSISGTTPGTSGSGGFLGIGKKSTTTEILDSGVQFFGTMFDLFRSQNADINLFESVRTTRSRSGFLGIGGGTSSSTDMFFQDLEQTNKRAYDQLIKALGSTGDLVYAMADFAGIAEDEVTTALKSLNVDELVSLRGLKGEEFTNELRALMGTLISDASYSIISQYEDFANFGEDLGEAVLRVQDSNKKVRQQLKNMMSADIEDTLNLQGVVPELRTKIVSSISDTITWASGPQGHADWSTIANMGGKIAQGLYRAYTDATNMAVESGTQFTNESFTAILQKNFSELSTADLEKLRSAGFDWANEVVEVIEDGVTRKFDQASIKFESARITEDLIKLAGSEEAFFEQSTFFMENFMTEAERLVPAQKAVTTELARLADLGFTSADGLVDTREELAQLVQGLDKTDPVARKAYQALMNLAPGFDLVASRAESFSEPIRDLQLELLRATDKTEEYESATRALAISGFTAAEIASYDLRKSLEAEVKEADRVRSSLDRLAQESLMLSANLLKAQGDMEGYSAAIAAIETKDMKTAQELAAYNSNQSIKRQIENEEAANRDREQAAQEAKRAAEEAAQEAKRQAEEAAQKAQQVADQKLSLEQRIYSIQGNTNKLRELELRNVDSSNQALQSYVWALEDYTNILKETEDTIKGLREKATDEYLSASDKVVDAQKAIADLAIEAAKKMRDFGSSLREFVNEQLMPESSANVTRLFTQTVQGALSGDEQALDSVRDIATQAIEAAKASARTSVEFNKARSTILASVSDVAAYAEAQAALTEIPEEDPLVLANKTLEEALKEQTDALYVANTIGASLVKSQEDLVALYFAAQSRVPSTPIAPFANGGIFDNDIIRRPTYFNLGLMGEAGAEAIMPLTRTRDGSLGVVATSEPNTNLGRAIGTQNAALVEQVKLLREEVSLLRYEARATAVSTTKTTRILERVTQNGESLLVTDTATL